MKHGYARVPAIAQDLTVQNEELKKEGCEIIFEEKFTGTKTDRPQFKQLLKELQESDTLLVTKLNRLARNTKEGIETMEALFERDATGSIFYSKINVNHTYVMELNFYF